MTKLTKYFLLIILIISLYKNSNSQVFWNEVTTPVTTALRCVSNINGNIAWVCGASGVVLKTTNAGYNWINYSGNGIPPTVTLINIYGIDINIALTAGYSGTTTYVFRTSNGGANWTQVFTQANGFINGIWMKSAAEGFMAGDPVPATGGRWSLWRTANGGLNWDSAGTKLMQVGNEAGWNSSLWVNKYGALGGDIWFGTNSSKIYHSFDWGSSWTPQSTGVQVNTYSICFDTLSTTSGLAGGATTLLKSTNNGTNWTTVTPPGTTGNINGIVINQHFFMPAAWLIRSGNTIYFSYPPFTNWNMQYTTPSGTYHHIGLTRYPAFGPGMLYAVKSNGGITRGNFILEGVQIISNEIPKGFKLYQNYPNPFNPTTKIKFELPLLPNNKAGEVGGALIRIKIYDALGREVETILDQVTQPGIYEDTWDGTNYPTGVYFYRVTISDPNYSGVPEYAETRKMVLVK